VKIEQEVVNTAVSVCLTLGVTLDVSGLPSLALGTAVVLRIGSFAFFE
jgi:hypothetical protein